MASEATETLLLEHLKRFHASHERIERKLEEVARRMANLEAGQASIIQHIGNLAAIDAQLQAQSDEFNNRLERIERRLELA